jgi:hypothetical protein
VAPSLWCVASRCNHLLWWPSASRTAAALPALAAIHCHLTAALGAVAGGSPQAEVVSATELIEEKLGVTVAAMAAAAGIAMEAVSNRETVALGERAKVTVGVWNSSSQPMEVDRVEVASSAGWNICDLYDWSGAEPVVRGEPLQSPPLVAVGELTVEGVAITLAREVVYRYAEQASGEVRRPVRAVPVLEVAVEPGLVVWPIQAETTRNIEVTLTSNTDRRLSGHLEVELPAGWSEPIRMLFAVEEPQGREVIEVVLPVADSLQPGAHSLAVKAVLDEGGRFDTSYAVVDYPHVRPSWLPTPAAAEIRALDLRLPRLDRVGYIRGAADRVPEFLREVGVPVELLEVGELANGELSEYEAIVVGPRAYEKDPALARVNPKLLEYVRSGGLLIVQYQQYQFIEGGFAPYPLEIARPHDRVTDETSPVRVLAPDHAVFQTPNAIDASDWLGWVQERGLYFAHTWDEAYTPLLVLQDPDQPEQKGGLLIASLGNGTYVYTGLSFFRELPAGVAGAYRLLANLLALAE